MAHEDEYWLEYVGSSFATPHVAGAAALIKEAQGNISNIAAKAMLINTARAPRPKRLEKARTGYPWPEDIGLLGKRKLGVWDERYGWGEVDARAAVETALAAGTLLKQGNLKRGETHSPQIDPEVTEPTVASVTLCWRRQVLGELAELDPQPVSHLDLKVEDDTTNAIVAQDLTDNGDNVKKLNFTALPNRTYTIHVTRDANDPDNIFEDPYALVSSFDFAT